MNDHETSTNEAIALLAGELHEKAHTLNQLTQGPPGLTEPVAAYVVLGNLAQTALGFVQAAEQIDVFLTGELDAGHLGHDNGDDPVPAVTTVHNALARATEQATDLGETLRQAAEALIPIHGLDGGEQPSPDRHATADLVEQAEVQVGSANRGFPKPIGDALSPAPGERALSPEPRSSLQTPHPRRER